MAKYILKRILLMIPVVFIVAIMIFSIMFFCPGDPVETIMGSNATEVQKEQRRQEMGLNDPYIVQLGRFLYDFFVKFDGQL